MSDHPSARAIPVADVGGRIPADVADGRTDGARIAGRVSWALVVGAALASLFGLSAVAPYRDNALVTASWTGNDLATLVVAVPVLAMSTFGASRRSIRSTLVWLGALEYVLYNFSFYLFGAALNAAFLLYEALVVGAMAALCLGLASLDVRPVTAGTLAPGPRRVVIGLSGLVSLGLGTLWVFQSLAFAVDGSVPAIVVATGHPTNITAALDLMLVVPVMAASSWLLLRGSPWGVVLGVVVHTKGVLYTVSLSAASAAAGSAGYPDAAAQIPIWLALGAMSAVCLALLLRPLEDAAIRSA